MADLLQDIRLAVRAFRTQRAFTAAVIMTIALGTGASTAMFSVLHAVLLKPLPQSNAPRIVRLYQPNDISQATGLSPLEIADFKAQAGRVLEDVVEYHSMAFTFVGGREPQRLQTGVVSATFFDALGVRPLLGRSFRAGEDQPGAEPVLLLSHAYWQREFGGDVAVLGRTLEMNDRSHTVIGVLPPFPQYPGENDVYMPSSSCPFRAGPGWAENRSARGLATFALLRAGIGADAALPDLRTVAARLRSEHPDAYRADVRYDIAAVPLAELIARPARASLVLLLGATLLLLGIVCSNVGNLMIVRVLRRSDELAVRLAFGASRGRVLRQLLTESAVFAAAGGAAGLLVAFAATRLLSSFLAGFSPRAAEIAVSGPVLLFTLAAAATAALAAGLLPATALRNGVGAALKEGTGRSSGSGAHAAIRNALVVIQVAVTLVLLSGAGVLLRTLTHMQNVDTGFDAAGVMTARLDLNWTRYDSADRAHGFYRDLEQQLEASPGVLAAGLGSSFPLNGDGANPVSFAVEHARDSDGVAPAVAALSASPGYFSALGVAVQRGRTFDRGDDAESSPAVVAITRSLAERYWPRTDPIGARVSLDGGSSWATVVAVVGDLRLGLEGDYDHLVFIPHNRYAGIESRLLVRTALPPAAAERMIRAAVAALDPEQPVTEIRPLEAHRGERLSPYRLTTLLMTLFALIALGVTALGLGGAIAFSVAQRTREIGIRIAIGARPPAVLLMILRQTAALAIGGIALGVVAAAYVSRMLDRMSGGLARADLLTWSGVIALILVVTTAAGLLPAWRAVRIDPLAALHDRR